MKEILKVVVAGDVDSGKSTLIGRFLKIPAHEAKRELSPNF